MFYLIQFVKSLGETLIRGFSFFFLSCLLAFSLTHRSWIAQFVEKISPEKMANPYFVAVIDPTVNSMRLTKLVNSLPGVVAIQEKSNDENETKIHELVSQLGSDYQVSSDLLQFKSIKFVLSPSLSEESLAFVRQQVIKYGGQTHVNATDIKYPEVTELMKTNPFYHALADYGDWLMISLLGIFWIISFWLVYDAFRARSYIIEKFQRKTDVAAKILASGLGAIVLLFTGSGVFNGTMKFFDLVILLMIFSIFWSFSLKNWKWKSLR